MTRIAAIALFMSLGARCLASPAARNDDGLAAIGKRADQPGYNLDDLNKEFKGIMWDEAWKQCPTDKFKTIVETFRTTKDFLRMQDYDKIDLNDGAWHNYFLRPNPEGKKYLDRDWNVSSTWNASLTFPPFSFGMDSSSKVVCRWPRANTAIP